MADENTDTHPCPGKWQWWAGDDFGEKMIAGPAESREALIANLKADRLGEYQTDDGAWRLKAHIGEYQQNNQDLADFFHAVNFLETAAEQMDEESCGSDENGDHHPIEEITEEQSSDLQVRVRATIRQWQRDHGLALRSCWFHESRNEETIDIALDDATLEPRP